MASNDTAEQWRAERWHVAPERWLEVLRDEYLTGYLDAGGSAVRFVSGDAAVLAAVEDHVESLCGAQGCRFTRLNCGELTADGRRPDYHRIEKLFFAVTAGVDWRGLAERQTRAMLAALGVTVPPDCGLSELDRIAAANGRDVNDLVREYQTQVTQRLVADRTMEYEFRAALTALGRAQLLPESLSPTTEEVLLAWFAGGTVPGGAAALKRIHIFERITAANARHMLRSYLHWLPQVGYQGQVVSLDFRPYERKQRGAAQALAAVMRQLRAARESGMSAEEVARLSDEAGAAGLLTYSDRAYTDMLALLRRFIDEIDRFEHLLLLVLTTPDFYVADSPRHYGNYDALQTRIGLEVRDAHRANPAAALVHLGGLS